MRASAMCKIPSSNSKSVTVIHIVVLGRPHKLGLLFALNPKAALLKGNVHNIISQRHYNDWHYNIELTFFLGQITKCTKLKFILLPGQEEY